MMKTVLKNISLFFEKNPTKKQVLCKSCVCDSTITCPTYVKPRVLCMRKHELGIPNTACNPGSITIRLSKLDFECNVPPLVWQWLLTGTFADLSGGVGPYYLEFWDGATWINTWEISGWIISEAITSEVNWNFEFRVVSESGGISNTSIVSLEDCSGPGAGP